MKFYSTNSFFDNVRFADLCNACGIRAIAQRDGVLIDTVAYLSVKQSALPLWLFQNRRFIALL